MKLKIECPAEIREIIEDYKRTLQSQLAECAAADAAATQEIAGLEETLADLEPRIKQLCVAAVTSDAAAQDLTNAERREQAIKGRIEELARASVEREKPTLASSSGVCRAIFFHWQYAVADAITEQLKPFGLPPHLVSPLIARSVALEILRIMVEFPIHYPEANPGNVSRLFRYFDAALRGQVNLASDEADESAAGAAPAGDTAPADTAENERN
jgi:hypothetical protein